MGGPGLVPFVQNHCSWADIILKSGSMPYYLPCHIWVVAHERGKFVLFLTATLGHWSRFTGGHSSKESVYW